MANTFMHDLSATRRELVGLCKDQIYPAGRLNAADRNGEDFFKVVRGEVEYAAVAAAEWADMDGPFYRDEELKNAAFSAMDACVSIFLPDGAVGRKGDGNSTYFALVPMTCALVKFKEAGAEPERVKALTEICAHQIDLAHKHIPPVLNYFNPRALEAVALLWLFRLTGRQDYLDLCRSRMETIMAVQYPCGAQPYNIAGWIWGRRPSQVYQLLSAAMMLMVADELDMPDARAYVRRIMDYQLLSTTWRGHAIQTPFEGLYKIGQAACAPWHWPLALALGDDKYKPLANVSFDRWQEMIDRRPPIRTAGRYFDPVLGLMCMHMLNVKPCATTSESNPAQSAPYTPMQGIHALPDISTVFIHEPKIDIGMTVLTGYSAWFEADCGDVKLLAFGPETTESPTYRNFGTDALRHDWKTASELDECRATKTRAVLRGRGFTKWDTPDVLSKDFSLLHTRELQVEMVYEHRLLTLTYQVIKSTAKPVSNRLMMLIGVFPFDKQGELTIADQTRAMPSANDPAFVDWQATSGPVSMRAPDGSRITVTVDCAGGVDRVTVERPEQVLRHGMVVKPANDGFLRVGFEGPDVLTHGVVKVRFEPTDVAQH